MHLPVSLVVVASSVNLSPADSSNGVSSRAEQREREFDL